MQLLHGFPTPSDSRRGIVAIGNFDGVHRGHGGIVSLLVERAGEDDAPAVVVTFDPHPIRLLRPEHAPPSLTTVEQKAALLGDHGVDFVVVMPTDRELLSLSPQEFFERVIAGEFEARGLVEGPNFRFGKDRAGDIETLRTLCESRGMTLDVAPPIEIEGGIVSSSRIRELVAAGEIAEAVELLGHPYGIVGTVSRGAGRGASLGFPTANLDGIETLIPPDGVYGGRAEIEGASYIAAVHIGGNPTFQDARRKFEVHLIGYRGDLYGRELEVQLTMRVRGSRQFADAEELRMQLLRDIKEIQAGG